MVGLRVFIRSPKSCIQRHFLSKPGAKRGRLFLQIGAGVGNRDPRTSFRDGFTEFIKGLELTANDRVVLVEPNPENVELLKECWSAVECASIVQLAVVPRDHSERVLTLWYASEDGPHFQIASHDKTHVARHYPQGTFRSFDVTALPIDVLINQVREETSLELMGIDVEGLDAEILLSVDWLATDFHAVSFESLHMGEAEVQVRQVLHDAGYVSAGVGLDVHGLDSLVIKPDSPRLRFLTRFWEVERQAHLFSVDGKPWKSMLYLVNWYRTRNT